MTGLPDIRAAGAVVTRRGGEVLLVHRPRYQDWSFPKGKADRGEHIVATAVREVAEETGVHIRLGPPLRAQRYPVAGRMKTVHYWVARAVGDDDVSRYQANDEIDGVRWVGYDQAMELLSYDHDRETLRESAVVRKKSRALVVLRHGKARSRTAWRRPDRERPLVQLGRLQAYRLVPVLAAYDVTCVLTSDSTRCLQTVEPYAATTGWEVSADPGLSEEGATVETVLGAVDDLIDSEEGAVLCTHRPVLPTVFDALGVADVRLEPADLLVVHHRKGRVLATEQVRIGPASR